MPPLLPLTPLGVAELSSVRSAVARLNLTHFDTDLGATKRGPYISPDRNGCHTPYMALRHSHSNGPKRYRSNHCALRMACAA